MKAMQDLLTRFEKLEANATGTESKKIINLLKPRLSALQQELLLMERSAFEAGQLPYNPELLDPDPEKPGSEITIAQLKSENSTLEHHVAELETENLTLKHHVAELKTENSMLKNHIAKLKTKNSALKNHVAELKAENSALKNHVVELESENSKLRTQTDHLMSANQEVRSELEALRRAKAAPAPRRSGLVSQQAIVRRK